MEAATPPDYSNSTIWNVWSIVALPGAWPATLKRRGRQPGLPTDLPCIASHRCLTIVASERLRSGGRLANMLG
jgi:hypothetical protein